LKMIRDETKTKAVKRRPNLILPASGEHLASLLNLGINPISKAFLLPTP